MTEQRTVQYVLVILGALAVITLAGGIYLTANDQALPGELIAIGSAAAGAVASMLSRTSSGVQEVEVVNRDEDPVPVDAEAGRSDLESAVLVGLAAFGLVVLLLIFI